MALEFSTVAAGLPMAASFAMASGFVAVREARRRSSLNAAMHELRRPLQALSLLLSTGPAARHPAEDTIEMAVAAVEHLDREINGRPGLARNERFLVRPVVEAAAERWRPEATRAQRSLQLTWSGGDGELEGDPIDFAQAVDNMISNALEHGGGSISLAASAEQGRLRLSVRDQGGGAATGCNLPSARSRLSGRGRHGHGLRIVREIAARHGGDFILIRSGAGTEANLALPLRGGRR